MKTAELTGALLNYWVARAEGVPADKLFFYETPYTKETVCGQEGSPVPTAVQYSTDWAQGGPLIEKYSITIDSIFALWAADIDDITESGDTPLQAICRAVVRAAFGDEVGEVAC